MYVHVENLNLLSTQIRTLIFNLIHLSLLQQFNMLTLKVLSCCMYVCLFVLSLDNSEIHVVNFSLILLLTT